MINKFVMNGVIFFVGLLIAINGAASFDFNLSKITFYSGLTTIIGIGLMTISAIFFFKQKSTFKKH